MGNATARGIAGGQASPLPSVIVSDERGYPITGVEVTFSMIAGEGSVTGGVQQTDASGVATVGGWTLGAVVGANTVVATSPSLSPVTFTAITTAYPPGSVVIAKVAGDDQSAMVDGKVQIPPKVVVKDLHGNVLPGVAVYFSVRFWSPSLWAGGQVSAASILTNASGEASVEWTLARRAGANQLFATVEGSPKVTFAATGTPGRVAMADVDPDFFSILIGDTVKLHAVPMDGYANVISGLPISWESAEPVASVSAEGLLTGLSNGYVLAKPTFGGITPTSSGADVVVYGAVDSTSFVFTTTVGVYGWTQGSLQSGATTCHGLFAFGSARRPEVPWTEVLHWTPTVSDPSIVSVTSGSQPGTHCFRALRSGTVTVSGTFGGATASKTLTVP